MGALCSKQQGTKKDVKDYYKPSELQSKKDASKNEKLKQEKSKDPEKEKNKSEEKNRESSESSPVLTEPADDEKVADKSKKEKSDQKVEEFLRQDFEKMDDMALPDYDENDSLENIANMLEKESKKLAAVEDRDHSPDKVNSEVDDDKISDKSSKNSQNSRNSSQNSQIGDRDLEQKKKSDDQNSRFQKEQLLNHHQNIDEAFLKDQASKSGEPGFKFTIPTQGKFYDEPNEELTEAFSALNEGSNFQRCESIKLSGNSFGMEACKWIAENILFRCTSLKKVDFSDIFTTRARDKLPASLKFMIDAIIDKKIVELNLSHNAFGPDGVTAYVEFLERCSTLKILNVTNCGLGPQGSQMIAEAILKNDKMRLTEFSASRDRLENPGIEALSKVFSTHGTLEKIEVYQNGIRMGLSHFFKALLDCADTIEYVDVSDNLIKRETEEMIEFIKICKKVKHFNLSDSLIKKNQQIQVVDALVESVQQGSALENLVWNQDPKKSTVNYFVDKMSTVSAGYKLQNVEMAGIFMKKENRTDIQRKCQDFFFQILLFKPDFTDDESDDHDDSEEESSSDNGQSSGDGDNIDARSDD